MAAHARPLGFSETYVKELLATGWRRARLYGLIWEIARQMVEQEPLVPHQWDVDTDVVVARLGTAGFSCTQRLIAFGPSPRINQAKEERSYEEYMAR
jgi:hypothetical protein